MLTDLAKVHHRWGFDKMMAKIKQNYAWNHKRVYRVYCELKLNLRVKPRKRRSPRQAKMLVQPIVPNYCWSLDFMNDTLSNKRKFRTLNVIDDYNRVGIEHRPAIADEKTEFGHFEIDTVVGRDHQSYLLTLVDKANKMCCIRKMPNKQAKTVINTFMNVVGSTFFDFKTITSDNGTEFAGHEAISKITEADFYFARPYRSCDRGLNEHTNGLIRRFLPKGTDFNEISDKEIAKIEHTLNTRRRASLNYCSPNHVFLEYLMAA
ncbi:Transposase, IS30 family [Piscirickettsia salmonis]|nr:IS30 family transposase [Piscirickettsia salmonis]QGP39467.1 Transposase, IS30 family [Piscirickettsia salmonis]